MSLATGSVNVTLNALRKMAENGPETLKSLVESKWLTVLMKNKNAENHILNHLLILFDQMVFIK